MWIYKVLGIPAIAVYLILILIQLYMMFKVFTSNYIGVKASHYLIGRTWMHGVIAAVIVQAIIFAITYLVPLGAAQNIADASETYLNIDNLSTLIMFGSNIIAIIPASMISTIYSFISVVITTLCYVKKCLKHKINLGIAIKIWVCAELLLLLLWIFTLAYFIL